MKPSRNLVSQEEQDIAIKVLNGESVKSAAMHGKISIGKVVSIVNRFCRGSNRYFYIKIQADRNLDAKNTTYKSWSSLKMMRQYKNYFIHGSNTGHGAKFSTSVKIFEELKTTTGLFKNEEIKGIGRYQGNALCR